jgi:hypothetical protein
MADGNNFLLPRRNPNHKPKGGAAIGRLGAPRHGSAHVRQRKVANMLAERGETPLEIMHHAYSWFYNEAVRWQAERDALPADASQKQRDKIADRIKGYLLLAADTASKASPFCHARIATSYIRGDDDGSRHIIMIEPGDETI